MGLASDWSRSKASCRAGLGGRDDVSLQKFLDTIVIKDRTFITENWADYHHEIPENQLFTGKDLTFPIG